jgi:hypothetical protein
VRHGGANNSELSTAKITMENQPTQSGGTVPAVVSDALLADVVRYRRGLGRYNFSRLPDDERGIAALEAWEELETRIDAHLHAVGIKVG